MGTWSHEPFGNDDASGRVSAMPVRACPSLMIGIGPYFSLRHLLQALPTGTAARRSRSAASCVQARARSGRYATLFIAALACAAGVDARCARKAHASGC